MLRLANSDPLCAERFRLPIKTLGLDLKSMFFAGIFTNFALSAVCNFMFCSRGSYVSFDIDTHSNYGEAVGPFLLIIPS